MASDPPSDITQESEHESELIAHPRKRVLYNAATSMTDSERLNSVPVYLDAFRESLEAITKEEHTILDRFFTTNIDLFVPVSPESDDVTVEKLATPGHLLFCKALEIRRDVDDDLALNRIKEIVWNFRNFRITAEFGCAIDNGMTNLDDIEFNSIAHRYGKEWVSRSPLISNLDHTCTDDVPALPPVGDQQARAEMFAEFLIPLLGELEVDETLFLVDLGSRLRDKHPVPDEKIAPLLNPLSGVEEEAVDLLFGIVWFINGIVVCPDAACLPDLGLWAATAEENLDKMYKDTNCNFSS